MVAHLDFETLIIYSKSEPSWSQKKLDWDVDKNSLFVVLQFITICTYVKTKLTYFIEGFEIILKHTKSFPGWYIYIMYMFNFYICFTWLFRYKYIYARKRWNRTTEHMSSPTDLKSALHTSKDHSRINNILLYMRVSAKRNPFRNFKFFKSHIKWSQSTVTFSKRLSHHMFCD